jgi:site-specific recombinase XerD
MPVAFCRAEIQLVRAYAHFATRLLEVGDEIRTVRERLADKDVRSTTIYAQVLEPGKKGVWNPTDAM